MGILWTGNKGTTLKDIITQLGNNDYKCIECRCLWEDPKGNKHDDLFGYCQYINGELIPLDGDTYSLNDLYVKWEEWVDTEETLVDNGGICLTVWEDGVLGDDYDNQRIY